MTRGESAFWLAFWIVFCIPAGIVWLVVYWGALLYDRMEFGPNAE